MPQCDFCVRLLCLHACSGMELGRLAQGLQQALAAVWQFAVCWKTDTVAAGAASKLRKKAKNKRGTSLHSAISAVNWQ